MTAAASWLFTFRGRVGRGNYLLAGVLLFALKLGFDALLVQQLLGRPWTPLFYLQPLRWTETYPVQARWHYAVFTLWALPFLWMGTALSVRRLRDAGLSPLWVALFVLPVVNVVFFVLLACMPGGRERIASALAEERRDALPVGDSGLRTVLVIVGAGVLATVVAWLAGAVIASYGETLFLGVPFLQGMFVSALLCANGPRSLPRCQLAAFASFLFAGALLLVFGIEGFACLIAVWMMGVVPMVIGAFLGWSLVNPRWQTGWVAAGVLLMALPALALGERAAQPPPSVFAVTTSVIVQADPETVWRHVVSFPPLSAPVELPFRAGIAYPVAASIEGAGPGALRKCSFNTGDFVEPIITWDPPRLLAFSVIDSPEPLIEWNPFYAHVDAPHLHGYFRAQHGEFRLVPLADGTTRLEGTTWYAHGLWPEEYWRLWSDLLVHAIHRRVLEHVKALSEGGG